jgi:CubicO group peptidase (beta-lactamase class C family)
LGLFLIFGIVLTGCNPEKSITRKRIKTVERGLMRAVYLKGMPPEKLTLRARMEFYHIPGVGIAVLDKNKLEWARAYGEKDNQTRQPLTEETLFQAGSFSEMMAAAAAVQLVEQGKLDLEGSVSAQLRSWRFPPVMAVPETAITPGSLLTHSAGISDQVFDGYEQGEPLPSLMQIINGENPARNRPVWIPGRKSSASRTRYSEPGYVILEQLFRDVTNRPFDAYIKETILDPLGLKSSTFALPLPEEMKQRTASGHVREGQPAKGLWKNYPEAAANGLWTTPTDFALFLAELLQTAGDGPGKILSPGSARFLLSPQVEGYGFGFMVEGRGDDINFNLRGRTHGYACFMTVYPAKGQGAVIMTNSDNGPLLIQEILCALSEVYDWPHYKSEEKPVLRLDPETYRQYVGKFEVTPDYVLDVEVEDYYLVIRPTGQTPTKFYAEGQTLFYAIDPYVRVQFIRDSSGMCDRLVLWQQDYELEAKRIK